MTMTELIITIDVTRGGVTVDGIPDDRLSPGIVSVGDVPPGVDVLRDAICHTVGVLEKVDLVPEGWVITPDTGDGKVVLRVGDLVFCGSVIGSDHMARYAVTITEPGLDPSVSSTRVTSDLDDVRAWLIHWSTGIYHR